MKIDSANSPELNNMEQVIREEPTTVHTADVTGAFFKSLEKTSSNPINKQTQHNIDSIIQQIEFKIIEGMQWGYWTKVASAIKNFFVCGCSFEKAVSSPYWLFRVLPTDQKLNFLENVCQLPLPKGRGLKKPG